MTSTVSTKPLTTLAAEMTDFLALGPDLGLPALDRVALSRRQRDSGWHVVAYPDERDAASAIDTVYAWAAFSGSAVHLRTPYAATHQPSGWQLSLETRVVVAEVPIEIHANLDADAYAAAREPVHATGPFAGLLLLGDEVAS